MRFFQNQPFAVKSFCTWILQLLKSDSQFTINNTNLITHPFRCPLGSYDRYIQALPRHSLISLSFRKRFRSPPGACPGPVPAQQTGHHAGRPAAQLSPVPRIFLLRFPCSPGADPEFHTARRLVIRGNHNVGHGAEFGTILVLNSNVSDSVDMWLVFNADCGFYKSIEVENNNFLNADDIS